MATRARKSRIETPGYRPKPEKGDRLQISREGRRRARQDLARALDGDEIALVPVEKRRQPHELLAEEGTVRSTRGRGRRGERRYKPVQKTAFWKRRGSFKVREGRRADRLWAAHLAEEAAEVELAEEWGVEG